MKKQKENSHEGITWSEMGKQNVQAEKVYWGHCKLKLIEIKFNPIQVFDEGGKSGVPGEKLLWTEKRTNKLYPHMTPSLESNPSHIGGRPVLSSQGHHCFTVEPENGDSVDLAWRSIIYDYCQFFFYPPAHSLVIKNRQQQQRRFNSGKD